jgi:AcrR family transcriptional regulator
MVAVRPGDSPRQTGQAVITEFAAADDSREETRVRVLDVALQLIAAKGFAATSTREISERLGFTKAALYYHFRTKDDLLAALVAPAIEELAAMVEGRDPRPAAGPRRGMLAAYIDLVAAHENLIRVLSEDPSVAHRPAFSAAAPLYERLTDLLAGQESPGTAQRARVRATLGGIHAALLHAGPGEDRTVLRQATLAAACGALGIPGPRAF